MCETLEMCCLIVLDIVYGDEYIEGLQSIEQFRVFLSVVHQCDFVLNEL